MFVHIQLKKIIKDYNVKEPTFSVVPDFISVRFLIVKENLSK